MGAALPAHVFMQAPKRPNGTFLQVMLGVSSSVRRVHTELLTAFRRDRALKVVKPAVLAGQSTIRLLSLTASRLRQPL